MTLFGQRLTAAGKHADVDMLAHGIAFNLDTVRSAQAKSVYKLLTYAQFAHALRKPPIEGIGRGNICAKSSPHVVFAWVWGEPPRQPSTHQVPHGTSSGATPTFVFIVLMWAVTPCIDQIVYRPHFEHIMCSVAR